MSSSTLSGLLDEIDSRKAEWGRLQPVAPERLQRIRDKIRLEWNYHSNAIEGNRITLGETRALLKDNVTPAGKTFDESRDIRGHDHAISCIYDWIERKVELTEGLIRDLHKVLLVEEYDVEAVTSAGQNVRKRVRLGDYKREPNCVVVGGKEILYSLPQETPAEMHKLLTWYRKNRTGAELHPVAVAALFHHQFTRIHPFDDGNGRLGRLLLNFVLMEHNYVPVVLSVNEREAYISALRSADADTSAIDQLTRFIAEAELASFDLHCRGARGDNIEGITDLDKAILMLKRQLSKVEEPQPLNVESQIACFEHSIIPLLTRTKQKLEEFDEFFATRSLSLSGNMSRGNHIGATTLEPSSILPEIKRHAGDTVGVLHFGYAWRGFKRARLNTFDHHITIQFTFEMLKWRATWLNEKGLERWYQQELGEDTIREIVDALRRDIVSKIEKAIYAR